MERSTVAWLISIRNVESYRTAATRNMFNREIELELRVRLTLRDCPAEWMAWVATHIARRVLNWIIIGRQYRYIYNVYIYVVTRNAPTPEQPSSLSWAFSVIYRQVERWYFWETLYSDCGRVRKNKKNRLRCNIYFITRFSRIRVWKPSSRYVTY